MPTRKLQHYILGGFHESPGEGVPVFDPYTGEEVARVSGEGLDFGAILEYARQGGQALRRLSFAERGRILRALAEHLSQSKEALYEASHTAGATRKDAWYDVDGGIGVLFSYASLARNLPEGGFLPEEEYLPLSKDRSFQGRHVLVPKEGVTVQINAFNFPVWGLLEKFAPAFLAGVPTLAKPATPSAQVAARLVEQIHASRLLPEGSLQVVYGGLEGLWERLSYQDSVFFTGSQTTALRLRGVLPPEVLFNAETDSLNAALLGRGVTEPLLHRFAEEVFRELSIKAGQRCTAIRRVLVPRERVEEVAEAIGRRLSTLRAGDPREEATTLSPLVSLRQKEEVGRVVEALLKAGASLLYRHPVDDGAFFPPTLLLAQDPFQRAVHTLEPFGPVATLVPYETLEEAVVLANLGGGSLVATIATEDLEEARTLVRGLAPHHGRLHLLNHRTAERSTGHGSPLPRLLHGGPGRAGGGEELGGLLAVKRHLQRVALQADPESLTALLGEHAWGAEKPAGVHPFRKYYEDLEVGETLTTHRRTVTEADIAAFANLSWDHFYAHTDELAARESLFGKRVAHGYFVLSAAAGLFVDPAPGPVLANYGLESLRFLEPVGVGDTLQARLTVKSKRPRDERTGVVAWDVEVVNQEGKPVAVYTILTLVQKRP